ncbi:MAG TPA: 3-isopropylmalate dehydrogenase, partial [Euryarchaeota archaeon]|nr:3-isopropylmalate dehydrogenase [Euryarchaeota archaeon]
GANINPEGLSMFEPIHGSAPKYKGKNVANPIAAIWSGALMLRKLGRQEAYDAIIKAIEDALVKDKIRPVDIGGNSKTNEIGDAIARRVKENS